LIMLYTETESGLISHTSCGAKPPFSFSKKY
jgi:hypothetical protein